VNEEQKELLLLWSSAMLDPQVRFKPEHKGNIRMVRNALQKPQGQVHKLSRSILRNSFLYGCVEFTKDEPVEHLVLGFGKRSGGGTNISEVLHLVGDEGSVAVPPVLIRLIKEHAWKDRSSESIIFHNHPLGALDTIISRSPLASKADRQLMLLIKYLEPFFLLRRVFREGTLRLYVAQHGKVKEIKLPYWKDIFDLLEVLKRGGSP